MSDKILGTHSGIVEGSMTSLLPHLRFVRRPVVECGNIKEQLVLQQAVRNEWSGEITWVDVPICDEETGTRI